MRKIILKHGQETLVDDEDFDFLNQWLWRLNSKGYVVRTDENQKTVRMHRLIMKTPKELECDHIKGNKLDNRKKKLRNCSHATNMSNCKMHSDNTSGYRGVSFQNNVWIAQIRVNNKRIYLGCSKDIKEAVQLYNNGATKYFGKFAKLNSVT